MKKYIFLMIMLVIAIITISVYATRSQGTPVPTRSPITIGVVPFPSFGAFYLAQEKGFFAKEGVGVNIVQLSSDTMLSALGSNQVQLLIGSSDMMTIVADAKIPAKQIFSTDISYGADGLLVSKDISSVSDLKGKKVYLPYGFPSHFFIRTVAQKAGLKPQDIELVNLDAVGVSASFVSGKIDAGMTWEPYLSTSVTMREGGKILITSKDEPNLITDIVMARTDVIGSRRSDIEAVMRAYFDATEWWKKNQNEGDAIAARNFNLSVDQFAPMVKTVKFSDLQTNLKRFDRAEPLNVYNLVDMASAIFLQDKIISSTVSGESVTDASLLEDLHATHYAPSY